MCCICAAAEAKAGCERGSWALAGVGRDSNGWRLPVAQPQRLQWLRVLVPGPRGAARGRRDSSSWHQQVNTRGVEAAETCTGSVAAVLTLGFISGKIC